MTSQKPNNFLSINLGAIAENFGILQKTVGPHCQVGAVVKADCYRLGADRIVPVLEQAGCDFFYVGSPDEALFVRTLTDKPIGMLNGPSQGREDALIAANIMPVLQSLADIESWLSRDAPAIIHFDTGMNRLGLRADETAILCDRIATDPAYQAFAMRVPIIMSHLACGDDVDDPLNKDQRERFTAIADHFPAAQKSLANSFGIFCGDDFHFNQVRPGMALYGLNPQPGYDNPMTHVVSYHTRILQIATAQPDETAGYGATHAFSRETLTATIATGYKDGFLRTLGNSGAVYINGHACPIVGRISMDLTIIDIGHLRKIGDDAMPSVGDYAELLGPHQSADTLALAAGTIGYEILTALGNGSPKIYID